MPSTSPAKQGPTWRMVKGMAAYLPSRACVRNPRISDSVLSSDFAAGMVCAARWDWTGSACPSHALMDATTTQEIVAAIHGGTHAHASASRHAGQRHARRAIATLASALVATSLAAPSALAQNWPERSITLIVPFAAGRRVGCLVAHHGRGDVEASGPEHHHRERRGRRRRDRIAARQECQARRLHDRLRPHGHACGRRRDQPEAALRPQDRLRLSRHPPRDAAIS